jgi:hypothetical protein
LGYEDTNNVERLDGLGYADDFASAVAVKLRRKPP